MKKLSIICFSILVASTTVLAQKMDNKRLSNILMESSDSIVGENGYWELLFKDLPLTVITDETYNRMRVVCPIARIGELQYSVLLDALKANFHSALDVKYAISDDIIWTVFIHPLKELSEGQVSDALRQVYFATINFGDSYSSTNLVFPAKEE